MKLVTLHITKNPKGMLLDEDHKAVAPGASLAGYAVKRFVVDADCLLHEADRLWFSETASLRARPSDEALARAKTLNFPCVGEEMEDEAIYDAMARGPGPVITKEPAAEAALPDTNPKSRVGATKPSMGAIPAAALLHLGGAMDDGKKKYGQFNWREHSVAASVYNDAIWRHFLAWQDGEDAAQDSGRHHLAHVMACCAIMLDAMETGNLIDDRGPEGVAAELIAKWTKDPLDVP